MTKKVIVMWIVTIVWSIAPLYGITSELLMKSSGENVDDQLGYSVSSAGDVNGDGYDDVIVGVHFYDVGTHMNVGAAYIYFGGPSMDTAYDVKLVGENENDQFGSSVSSAGDVNGDGYDDVIVGAPYYDNGSDPNVGAVYIFFGGPSMDIFYDLKIVGEDSANLFGSSVSSAGDVNGDGYDDVIIGMDDYKTSAGAAYIYFGGPSMDTTYDVKLVGENENDLFHTSVSSAGDVNGDGYDDVIVGAPYYDNGSDTNVGAAYIYFGGPSMDTIYDVKLVGENENDLFGSSVSLAGDVNGDGYDDVVIGADDYDTSAGAAYIYFGGPSMDTIYDVKLVGENENDQFGSSVSSAGDVNGDGYDDVIIGMDDYDTNVDAAYIYFGGPSMYTTYDVKLVGEYKNDGFAISVSSAGDVNGDGYDDVIVGAPWYTWYRGAAYIYDFYLYRLISPNGSETWTAGTRGSVEWTGKKRADIYLSTDGGVTWNMLLYHISGGDSNILGAEFPVPDIPTDAAMIAICDPAHNYTPGTPWYTVKSNSFFTIRQVPTLIINKKFYRETADTTMHAGEYTSLAVDASGNPCISYYYNVNRDLRYAYRKGGRWHVSEIDTLGDVGKYTSLALDISGNPHISYYDVSNSALKYAYEENDVWHVETVDNSSDDGRYSSIKVDKKGNPHISYYDWNNYYLKYAYKENGVWHIEAVDSAEDDGMYNTLSLDNEDNPHVSYYDYTNYRLKYAYKTGNTWHKDVVDKDYMGIIGSISMAIGENQHPYISYTDVDNHNLKCAYKLGGKWHTEVVVSGFSTPGTHYSSIYMDRASRINIVYYGDSDLNYAYKDNNSWYISKIDTVGDVGKYASFAMDGLGNLYVSYYDATNHLLKYVSTALKLLSPVGGENWSVGANSTLKWAGPRDVDVYVSLQGGDTWQQLLSNISGSESNGVWTYSFQVPHFPTRYAKAKFVYAGYNPDNPLNYAVSDTFFTIKSVVTLLTFKADNDNNNKVHLTWETDPGPDKLAGYNLYREEGNGNEVKVNAELIKLTEYTDSVQVPVNGYILSAVNGLGEEYRIGKVDFAKIHGYMGITPIIANTSLEIRYYVPSMPPFNQVQNINIDVVDISGKVVRTLVSAKRKDGFHFIRFDTEHLGNGVYFVQLRIGGQIREVRRFQIVR